MELSVEARHEASDMVRKDTFFVRSVLARNNWIEKNLCRSAPVSRPLRMPMLRWPVGDESKKSEARMRTPCLERRDQA